MRLRLLLSIPALLTAASGVLAGTLAASVPAQARPLEIELLRGTRRIAVIIGTFDPPTLGHIGTAQAALNEGDVDYVIMIPAPDPLGKQPLPLGLRQEMTQIAARGHDHILVPSVEQIQEFFSMGRGAGAWINKLAENDSQTSRALLAYPPKIMALLGDDKSSSLLSSISISRKIRPDGWIVSPRDALTEDMHAAPKLPGEVIQLKTAPVGISSTQVKSDLINSPGSYFIKGSTIVEALDPAVETYIRQKGLYLDRLPKSSKGTGADLKSAFRYKFLNPALNKLGFYEWARNYIVNSRKPHLPAQAPESGHEYKIVRHLGGGLHGDAYLIEIDGQYAVLKVYVSSKVAAGEIERDARVHRWLNEKTGIQVPEMYVTDPQEGYTISEYVEGPTIADHMNQPDKPLSHESEQELRQLVSEAGRVQAESGIALDLRSDNVILRDGHPYLVDLGTRTVPDPHVGNFEAKLGDWAEEAKVIAANKDGCPDLLTRVLSALKQ